MNDKILFELDFLIDGAYKSESDIWFITRDDNYLCRYLCDNEELFIVDKINDESHRNTFRLFSNCVSHNDTIVCIPDKAYCFAFYNLDSKTYETVNLTVENEERADIGDFWVIDDILWGVARGLNKIIALNMKKKEICFETEIFPEFDIKIGNGACMQDGTIYVSNQGKKDICIFDTTTFSKQFITVETREKGYNTVNVFCKYLYLTGKRKVLYKYNMEDGSIAEVDLDNSSFWICDEEGNIVKDAKSHIFKESYLINNEYLILIPWYLWDTTANSIVVFSISNNCINYFNVLNGMINSNVRGIRYICKPSFDENHKIVIYIDEYGTFSIDLSNNSVVKKKYIVKKVNVINKYLLDKGLIKEDELMSLKDFIDHVTREG